MSVAFLALCALPEVGVGATEGAPKMGRFAKMRIAASNLFKPKQKSPMITSSAGASTEASGQVGEGARDSESGNSAAAGRPRSVSDAGPSKGAPLAPAALVKAKSDSALVVKPKPVDFSILMLDEEGTGTKEFIGFLREPRTAGMFGKFKKSEACTKWAGFINNIKDRYALPGTNCFDKGCAQFCGMGAPAVAGTARTALCINYCARGAKMTPREYGKMSATYTSVVKKLSSDEKNALIEHYNEREGGDAFGAKITADSLFTLTQDAAVTALSNMKRAAEKVKASAKPSKGGVKDRNADKVNTDYVNALANLYLQYLKFEGFLEQGQDSARLLGDAITLLSNVNAQAEEAGIPIDQAAARTSAKAQITSPKSRWKNGNFAGAQAVTDMDLAKIVADGPNKLKEVAGYHQSIIDALSALGSKVSASVGAAAVARAEVPVVAESDLSDLSNKVADINKTRKQDQPKVRKAFISENLSNKNFKKELAYLVVNATEKNIRSQAYMLLGDLFDE